VGVLLTRHPDAPAPPAQSARAAAVPSAVAPHAAPEPPPSAAEPAPEASALPKAHLKPWPKRDGGAPAAAVDAGMTPAEAEVVQAKTNLGASLDTAERRRVPSTAE
jgi:hypothetical protein